MVERTIQATRTWRRSLEPAVEDRRVKGPTRRAVTPAPAPWPGIPVRPRGVLDEASSAQLAEVCGAVWRGSMSAVSSRRRGLTVLLDHLATYPGSSWQQRWETSGRDERGRPVRNLGDRRTAGGDVSRALASLFALRVVAPSLPALRSNPLFAYEQVFRAAQDDPQLDAFFAAMDAVPVSSRYKQHALFDVCVALTTQRDSGHGRLPGDGHITARWRT